MSNKMENWDDENNKKTRNIVDDQEKEKKIRKELKDHDFKSPKDKPETRWVKTDGETWRFVDFSKDDPVTIYSYRDDDVVENSREQKKIKKIIRNILDDEQSKLGDNGGIVFD